MAVAKEFEQEKGGAKGLDLLGIVSKYGTIIGLLLMVIIFSALRPQLFPTASNLVTILTQVALTAVVASGLTVCLVMNEFDLSIGWASSFIGILVTGLMARSGMNFLLAIAVGLVAGLVIGLFNGFIVTKLRVSAFIGTLATGSILVGLNYLYNKGETIYSNIPDNFLVFGRSQILGVPVIVIIMAIVLGLLWLVLTHMDIGRYMYAIGGNVEAAKLSGINVNLVRLIGFALSGATAAIGGIVLASRLGGGYPTAGEPFLLDAFAAAFLGAATLREGEFHILGTLVGVLILGVSFTGLAMLNVPFDFQNVVRGLFLIGAVALSGIARSR